MKNLKYIEKPIAEVQYLENERIPTVEEIQKGVKLPDWYIEKLKDLQTKFENNDLTVSCVYPNSYCSCDCPRGDYRCDCISDSYGNEKWIKLWMSCPSVDNYGNNCPSGNKNPTNWVHSAHTSYYTWISNKARIRCEKTSCSTSHMSNWSFKCGEHGFHNGEYIKGSFASFSSALSAVMNGDWGETSPKVDEVLISLFLHMKRNKHQFPR